MSRHTKKYISIDDYNPQNYELAKIIKGYGLEDRTIFFLHFPDLQKEKLAGEHSGALKMARDFSKEGFVIGSHTTTHCQLIKEPPNNAYNEVKDSKMHIERATGKECDWFAYPYGQYDQNIVEMVKRAGYKYARTTDEGKGNNFEIGALNVTSIKGIHGLERMKGYEHFYLHYYDLIENNYFKEFEEFLQWLADSA